MLYLDYLAYNNALKHVSVSEKLLLGGGGLALALTLTRPLSLLTIIFIMHLIMSYAAFPSNISAGCGWAPWLFCWSGWPALWPVLALPLFRPRLLFR